MAIKSYEVSVNHTFIVTIDEEMFTMDEVLDTMEYAQFPDADVYEFVDGSTTWDEYVEEEN